MDSQTTVPGYRILAVQVVNSDKRFENNSPTEKLRVSKNRYSVSVDRVIVRSMAADGFFAGNFMASPGKKSIHTAHSLDRRIDVKTMHISCKSDMYHPGHDYGGIIVYQYNGKSEWITANNTHCQCGYIVIQDTDSKNVKEWREKGERGKVHGAIYKNAFGESVNHAHVVGEGFAVRNGKSKIEINSRVFNNPDGSIFHDDRVRMHELTEHCVEKIVEYWKTAGPRWARQQNFEVKQLLEGFDVNSFQSYHLPCRRNEILKIYFDLKPK